MDSSSRVRSQVENNTMSDKSCLATELFPHDIIELILVKLPVKSLVKSKSVSKQWKSTIESRHFQETQLIHSQNSGDPKILLMNHSKDYNGLNIEALSTSVFKSSAPVDIPTTLEKIVYNVCPTSCDGLICFYNFYNSAFVVNPATRCHRSIPRPRLRQCILNSDFKLRLLGFGKDTFNGTYKLVWLVNSSELALENVTTCEIFDFSTNAWRYITPSSSYRITEDLDPVNVDGSLHWFTEKSSETKVVSLDLHTETFQVISDTPFASAELNDVLMSNLDNRLCVSVKTCPGQVIWSFDSCNKTWERMYVIELNRIKCWFEEYRLPLSPLAVLKRKTTKNELLISSGGRTQPMVVHDPSTQSFDLVFIAESIGSHVCYFESLVSIL